MAAFLLVQTTFSEIMNFCLACAVLCIKMSDQEPKRTSTWRLKEDRERASLLAASHALQPVLPCFSGCLCVPLGGTRCLSCVVGGNPISYSWSLYLAKGTMVSWLPVYRLNLNFSQLTVYRLLNHFHFLVHSLFWPPCLSCRTVLLSEPGQAGPGNSCWLFSIPAPTAPLPASRTFWFQSFFHVLHFWQKRPCFDKERWT